MKERIDIFSRKDRIQLLSIICPVYNESGTVEKSLRHLHEVLNNDSIPFEIIVVESNSDDGTRSIVTKLQKEFRYKLIFQDTPRGKGNAVRQGIRSISGDVFMIFDLDDEYDPRDLRSLLVPIEDGLTSFVLGSRHIKSNKIRNFDNGKFLATLMNVAHVFFTFLINSFFQVKLKDPFTMYKIMRKEIFIEINLVSNRFDLDWELVCVAIRVGAKPLELPVSYESRSFSQGKKIKLFLDPLTWMIAIFKFRFLPINRK